MMLCQIFLFAAWDLDILAVPEYQHLYSDWVEGDPKSTYVDKSELSRTRHDGAEETRTVTQEGLRSPVHSFSRANPPKYPAHQLTAYNCDQSIIGAVNAHAKIIVYAIDTIDPDDYDDLPEIMQGMKPDQPMKDSVFMEMYDGLVAVTPEGDQRTQVEVALNNWRVANPLGTARELSIAIRNFTS